MRARLQLHPGLAKVGPPIEPPASAAASAPAAAAVAMGAHADPDLLRVLEVRSEEGAVTVAHANSKQRSRSGSASAPDSSTSLGGHLLHADDHDHNGTRASSEQDRTQPSAPLKTSRPGFVGAARRRARAALAPLFSIRTLFVLSAILQVVGAVAVVFCIMWYMTQRSMDDLVTTLIRNLQRRADEIVEAYLNAATVVAGDLAQDVESGVLSRRSWRILLEELDHSIASFPSISVGGIRYTDGYSVGVESCDTDEPEALCTTGRRALFGNATHMMAYEMGKRGQPTRHLSTFPAVVPTNGMLWLKAVAASGKGPASTWFDVRYLYSLSSSLAGAVTLADPLDGMAVGYGSTFSELPSLDAQLPSGGPLPGTPGGTPASEPATPAEFFAASASATPVAGMVGVNIRLGDLSRRLLDAVQFADTLMIITTAQGRMVATSTRDFAHVINAKMELIAGSESPDALTRDLVRLFSTGAYADETVVVFESGSGRYFGSRAAIHVEPNLDLFLYTAVSRDGLLTDLVRARNIAFGVCGAWLFIAVVAAGVASWLITRPIDKIRVAMSVLLDTMTCVYAELRMHVDPEQTWTKEPRRRRSRWSGGGLSAAAGGSIHGWQSGIRELTAFDNLVADMQSRFVSFQEIVSAEAKLKMEMEVRSEETKKFLATVSHEMRTPLNGVLGMLDLARECALPPDAADYIESAAISGEHLLSLVNDILDLQKMEAGLIELSSVPVDVRAAVVAAVRIVKRRADEKGLQVGMDVAEGVPLLLAADPDRLRQVLLNLLSNAVKYTAQGAVEVRVGVPERPLSPIARAAASPRAARGDRVVLRFEVQDTGPGIAEEHQRSLFQRFFRVQHISGTEVDPGGTGLGLAISREIVEKAGGRIGCTSAPGRGCTFWFELPCGRVPAEASPLAPLPCGGDDLDATGTPHDADGLGVPPVTIGPATARQSTVSVAVGGGVHAASSQLSGSARSSVARAVAGHSSPGSPRAASSAGGDAEAAGTGASLRVLVAEDNAMSAKVITSMLQRVGHAVTLAADGAEAVRAFEEALAAAAPEAPAFDIIFMDCVMPVCDGFEATGRIRRLEAERGGPQHLIVALTAKAGSEDEAECRAAGMDAFLSKPVRRATLAAFVGGRLATGGGETPTGSDVASPQPHSAAGPTPLDSPRRPPRSFRAPASSGGMLESFGPAPASRPKPAPQPAPVEAAERPQPVSIEVAPAPTPMPPLALAPPTWSQRAEGSGGPLEPLSRPSNSPRRHSRGALGLTDQETTQRREERLAFEALAGGPGSAKAKVPRSDPSLVSDPAPGPSLDILVVDDVEMNRRVLRTLLEKEGHTVTIACDGREAAEAFERRAQGVAPGLPPFDLVFMDISMPVMDGYASTRRIRHAEEGMRGVPRTPVVACTALNSSKDREEMGAAGMDDLMVKPVGRPVVRAILAKWARSGRQTADGLQLGPGASGSGGGARTDASSG